MRIAASGCQTRDGAAPAAAEPPSGGVALPAITRRYSPPDADLTQGLQPADGFGLGPDWVW